MKTAVVHDYLREYGGAERVLKTISSLYPKAPIYTAFRVKNSTAGKEFKDSVVRESFLAPILKLDSLYSPLRFLIPVIWKSFNLKKYDLVITSASWYITRGFRVGKKTKIVCYCHTPPRWLYGFQTSVGFTKYLPVKLYAAIVGHFLRMYDFNTAQKVNLFLANSQNVKNRIEKFYRKNALVVYPPVEVEEIIKSSKNIEKENYYLIVSRLVGAKGLEEAAGAFKNIKNRKLIIVGETHGFKEVKNNLEKVSGGNIKLLGRVDDNMLYKLYAKARGFIALAKDEDFGMTVVEAQAAGTPVIAFNGGGFKETVVDLSLGAKKATGILINSTDTKTIKNAIEKLEKTNWDKGVLQENARKFSKEKFIENFKKAVGENK